MKRIVKIGGLILITLGLSGCLGTIAAVGVGLSAATAAGCNQAAQSPSANVEVVRNVCGSMFD